MLTVFAIIIGVVRLAKYSDYYFGEATNINEMLDNGDIMSLTVKNSDFSKIEEIIDDTWDWLTDSTGTKVLHTPVVFEGRIHVKSEEAEKRQSQEEYFNNSFSSNDDNMNSDYDSVFGNMHRMHPNQSDAADNSFNSSEDFSVPENKFEPYNANTDAQKSESKFKLKDL